MKPLLRVALFLTCFVSVAVCQSASHVDSHLPSRLRDVDQAGYYTMPTAVDDDYFDGTSSRERVRMHMKVAREVGARYLRCAFTWNAIEHAPGKYNWAFWDMLVDEADKAGIQLIPYVAYTPKWAAEKEDQFWKRPPRDPKLYADFMFQIASRYRGRIHSWEIWNEPDITEYWMGSPSGFAELVRQAAAAIRKADPSATLVLAGMSKGPSPFFEDLISKQHLERVVDVIAMHGYPESWLEEREETVFENWPGAMTGLVARDGSTRDLWLNEIGYADYRYSPTQANKNGISAVFPHEHTAEYAAQALFKAQVMALASQEVSMTGWYRIDDFDPNTTKFSDDEVNFHLGLLDVDGNPKPTFRALQFFNSLCQQPTRALLTSLPTPDAHSDAEIKVLQRKDGTLVVVGWLRSLEAKEVAHPDGLHADRRSETVNVPLPCKTLADVHQYDAQGRAAKYATTFESGWLQAIPLKPDSVFISEFHCVN
jgi:polysaccharide biosynthesis protein PslG